MHVTEWHVSLLNSFVVYLQSNNIILLSLAPTETHAIDLNNPRNHGEFLIGVSLNEKVHDGQKQVSSIVIAKPNTHPSEIPCLKTVSEGGKIIITSLAHQNDFITNQKDWLGLLEANKAAFEAEILVTVLMLMCTKMATGNKEEPVLKTTTVNALDKAGVALSHDYFANKETGELDLLPLPHKCNKIVSDVVFKHSESTVVWRAHIDKSEDVVKETEKKTSGGAAMDRMALLMKGAKIS